MLVFSRRSSFVLEDKHHVQGLQYLHFAILLISFDIFTLERHSSYKRVITAYCKGAQIYSKMRIQHNFP